MKRMILAVVLSLMFAQTAVAAQENPPDSKYPTSLLVVESKPSEFNDVIGNHCEITVQTLTAQMQAFSKKCSNLPPVNSFVWAKVHSGWDIKLKDNKFTIYKVQHIDNGDVTFPLGENWFKGSLQFNSSVEDNYRNYRLVFYMGDKAMKLWNKAGKFQQEDGGKCPQCEQVQILMDRMLSDCKTNGADVCVQKIDMSYQYFYRPKDKFDRDCLALKLPSNLGEWQECGDIHPANEVSGDFETGCLLSRAVLDGGANLCDDIEGRQNALKMLADFNTKMQKLPPEEAVTKYQELIEALVKGRSEGGASAADLQFIDEQIAKVRAKLVELQAGHPTAVPVD